MSKPFFEYFKEKRNSLLSGGRRSQKACEIFESIEMARKGEFIKIKVCDERDVHNIRSWLSNNKKHLKTIGLHTVYKKEEGVLYIYIK